MPLRKDFFLDRPFDVHDEQVRRHPETLRPVGFHKGYPVFDFVCQRVSPCNLQGEGISINCQDEFCPRQSTCDRKDPGPGAEIHRRMDFIGFEDFRYREQAALSGGMKARTENDARVDEDGDAEETVGLCV